MKWPNTREAGIDGPLTGLRVIELGSIVAGPFAGRLFADYGADVIKVEAPDRPDPMREWGQETYQGHALWWPVHARNKHCITLDLRSEEGRDALRSLAEGADVIVENFRPGTLESWGLSFAELSTLNPGLILARISGFGQDGPYSQRPGYASVAEAMGGLRAINGFEGEPPPRMAISLGDSLAGMFAVQGVLAALHHRHATGQGQVIDVALTEACLALLESTIPEYDATGRSRRPGGTRLKGIAPSNIYRSADERWVIVAANQDTVFRRLCSAMGVPELADDPRYADHRSRGDHQDELDDLVGMWVAKRPAAEVIECLDNAGVVVGPIYEAADIVADPHFQERDMIIDHFDERLGRTIKGPGIVPKFSATPGKVRWAGPPIPGSHNGELSGGLQAGAGVQVETR